MASPKYPPVSTYGITHTGHHQAFFFFFKLGMDGRGVCGWTV